MSNSSLVDYTKMSPHVRTRVGTISKITIHHMAGVGTVEQCGEAFQGSRVASSHYGIGNDGRVGQYADEAYRTVTSSSTANDNVAVTIEVSNSKASDPWPVSDKALSKLIELCADICRRNGIKKLIYTGDANGNLTRHNMFAATICPGPYLQERFPYIADEINKRLTETEDDDMDVTRFTELYMEMIAQTGGDNPSDWAKEACEKAKAAGVFFGDGQGNFDWQEPLTREAFAAVLNRLGLIG